MRVPPCFAVDLIPLQHLSRCIPPSHRISNPDDFTLYDIIIVYNVIIFGLLLTLFTYWYQHPSIAIPRLPGFLLLRHAAYSLCFCMQPVVPIPRYVMEHYVCTCRQKRKADYELEAILVAAIPHPAVCLPSVDDYSRAVSGRRLLTGLLHDSFNRTDS